MRSQEGFLEEGHLRPPGLCPVNAPDPELHGQEGPWVWGWLRCLCSASCPPASPPLGPSGLGAPPASQALLARPQLTPPPPLHPLALWKILQASWICLVLGSLPFGRLGSVGRCLGLSVCPRPQDTSPFRKCCLVSNLELSCCSVSHPFLLRPAGGVAGAPPPGLWLSTLLPGLLPTVVETQPKCLC